MSETQTGYTGAGQSSPSADQVGYTGAGVPSAGQAGYTGADAEAEAG